MESLLSKPTRNEVKKPARNEMEHPARNKIQIRIAVAGNSGVGKSAFINAIRGVNDDDENAARVGIFEMTREPTEYKHPKNPMISFVELPGMGTPTYPDLQTFCEKINLNVYDLFLILGTTRFTRNDLELAMKLDSIRKLLFVVRTKIDHDCRAEQRKKSAHFDEVKVLKEIRDHCKQNVGHLIQSDDHVFLISNYDRDGWDFERLVNAIYNKLPVDQREVIISSTPKAEEIEKKEEGEKEAKKLLAKKKETEKKESQTKEMETTETKKEEIDSTEEYLASARAYLNENGIAGIDEFLTKKLNEWKNVKIRFGITGDPGTGKSTFINAIRGLCDGDFYNGAAKVGVVETTTTPREYRHPDNPMICLVDLPGIGTPNYPDLETYCKEVNFESYDTFLIFTATRFTGNDLELAKKVKSLGKSFFLIRSKIDNDVRHQKGKTTRNEDEMLLQMRNYCIENVKGMISSDKIFLIDNYEREKWDFDRLVQAMGKALPVLQKESLILSLSNLTRGCLKRKANFLKVRAVAVAAISAVNGAIPLPEKRAAGDAILVKDTVTGYYKKLGIPDLTPDNFERFDEFEDTLRKYNFQSNEQVILSLESEADKSRKVQDVCKYIPILGTSIAGSISFAVTLHYLLHCVNELEKLALAVWDEAAKNGRSITL